MRIALFVTCLGDTLFPEAGRATVAAARAPRAHGRVPRGADLLRSDAREHRLRRSGDAAGPDGSSRCSGRASCDAVVAPSGSCVAMVRHQYARLAQAAGDAGWRARSQALAARVFELSEFLVDELGVEDVGAYYPHRVTYHPSCHALRMLQHRRGAAAAAAQRARDRSASSCPRRRPAAGSAARSRSRTPTPRRRCCPTRSRAILDTRRRGVHGARQLVPDAHRRRPAAPAHGRAHGPPRRDPRLHARRSDERRVRFPTRPRVTALGDAQLRHNLRSATHTIRDKRLRVVAELEDWEQLREAGRRIKAHALRHLDVHLEAARGLGHARRRHRPLGPRRAEGQPIVAELDRGRGRARGRQGQVDRRPTRSASTTRSPPRGITAQETDLAELINQLAGDTLLAHPRARRSTATAPRSATCSGASSPGNEDLSDEPAALADAARRYLRVQFLSARRRRQRRELRDRARPAPSASSSPRATGACAPRFRRR